MIAEALQFLKDNFPATIKEVGGKTFSDSDFTEIKPEPDPLHGHFDVNTLGKLQRLADGPAWEKWFGRDLAIIKVNTRPGGRFEWDVKIFEHEARHDYKLLHEKIQEIALPKRQIVESLRRYFRQVKALDPFGFRASDQSERLYFVGKAPRSD